MDTCIGSTYILKIFVLFYIYNFLSSFLSVFFDDFLVGLLGFKTILVIIELIHFKFPKRILRTLTKKETALQSLKCDKF